MKFKSHAHRKAVFANMNKGKNFGSTKVSREKVKNFEMGTTSLRPKSMQQVSSGGRMKGQTMRGVKDSGFSYQQFVSTDDYANLLYKKGIRMKPSEVSRQLGHLKANNPRLYQELMIDKVRMITYLEKQGKKNKIEKGLNILRRETTKESLREMTVEDARETLVLDGSFDPDILSDKMLNAMLRKVKSEKKREFGRNEI